MIIGMNMERIRPRGLEKNSYLRELFMAKRNR